MWVPAYLFVPFFYDTNSLSFLAVYSITLQIQLWGVIAYNFYFTVEFTYILKKMYTGSTVQGISVRKAKILATKSIIHCFTSSIANILYVYVPDNGGRLYNIIILAGIHFLFNFKIEKVHKYTQHLKESLGKGSVSTSLNKVYVTSTNVSAGSSFLRNETSRLNHLSKYPNSPAQSSRNLQVDSISQPNSKRGFLNFSSKSISNHRKLSLFS
jgi:hypothetical protein